MKLIIWSVGKSGYLFIKVISGKIIRGVHVSNAVAEFVRIHGGCVRVEVRSVRSTNYVAENLIHFERVPKMGMGSQSFYRSVDERGLDLCATEAIRVFGLKRNTQKFTLEITPLPELREW